MLKKYIKVEEFPADPQLMKKGVRKNLRDYEGLLDQVNSEYVSERRWAVRDLAEFSQACDALFKTLEQEAELSVREALFDSLQQIGGQAVVNGFLALLRSEDAGLRNGAIEILQSMPEGVAEHIQALLTDRKSDVRIFAIDILQVLADPKAPEWLLNVLKTEQHINVLAVAIDRSAEIGTPEMIPTLESLKHKFQNEEYLCFAIDMAITRIQGD